MLYSMPKPLIASMRAEFPEGTRVVLIEMKGDHVPPAGTQGTVLSVDDMGCIHVRWDNGDEIGVCYGVDLCRRLYT